MIAIELTNDNIQTKNLAWSTKDKEKYMIRSWRQFEGIRQSGKPLLHKLPTLHKPILVAGCQRSGTTAVTRILRSGGDFGKLDATRDDELDAALILAGELPIPGGERLVLQTTYLNNHYREYFEHNNFQLIWLIRNPHAVINSMLNNWSRGALRRLFHACGTRQLSDKQLARYTRMGHWGFSRLEMACFSYLEKAHQAGEIRRTLDDNTVRFLNYDRFVKEPETTIQSLCNFAEISYSKQVSHPLGQGRKSKASNRLSEDQKCTISKICNHSWQKTLELFAPQQTL